MADGTWERLMQLKAMYNKDPAKADSDKMSPSPSSSTFISASGASSLSDSGSGPTKKVKSDKADKKKDKDREKEKEEEENAQKRGNIKSEPTNSTSTPSTNDSKLKRKRRKMVDTDKLAMLLWRVILDHGGACHADTLAEYAFRDWQLLTPSIQTVTTTTVTSTPNTNPSASKATSSSTGNATTTTEQIQTQIIPSRASLEDVKKLVGQALQSPHYIPFIMLYELSNPLYLAKPIYDALPPADSALLHPISRVSTETISNLVDTDFEAQKLAMDSGNALKSRRDSTLPSNAMDVTTEESTSFAENKDGIEEMIESEEKTAEIEAQKSREVMRKMELDLRHVCFKPDALLDGCFSLTSNSYVPPHITGPADAQMNSLVSVLLPIMETAAVAMHLDKIADLVIHQWPQLTPYGVNNANVDMITHAVHMTLITHPKFEREGSLHDECFRIVSQARRRRAAGASTGLSLTAGGMGTSTAYRDPTSSKSGHGSSASSKSSSAHGVHAHHSHQHQHGEDGAEDGHTHSKTRGGSGTTSSSSTGAGSSSASASTATGFGAHGSSSTAGTGRKGAMWQSPPSGSTSKRDAASGSAVSGSNASGGAGSASSGSGTATGKASLKKESAGLSDLNSGSGSGANNMNSSSSSSTTPTRSSTRLAEASSGFGNSSHSPLDSALSHGSGHAGIGSSSTNATSTTNASSSSAASGGSRAKRKVRGSAASSAASAASASGNHMELDATKELNNVPSGWGHYPASAVQSLSVASVASPVHPSIAAECGKFYGSVKVLAARLWPGPGYSCIGCKTKTSTRWFHGPGLDDWHCASCGLAWSSEHTCPICGLVYGNDEDDLHDHDSDDDEEIEEEEEEELEELDVAEEDGEEEEELAEDMADEDEDSDHENGDNEGEKADHAGVKSSRDTPSGKSSSSSRSNKKRGNGENTMDTEDTEDTEENGDASGSNKHHIKSTADDEEDDDEQDHDDEDANESGTITGATDEERPAGSPPPNKKAKLRTNALADADASGKASSSTSSTNPALGSGHSDEHALDEEAIKRDLGLVTSGTSAAAAAAAAAAASSTGEHPSTALGESSSSVLSGHATTGGNSMDLDAASTGPGLGAHSSPPTGTSSSDNEEDEEDGEDGDRDGDGDGDEDGDDLPAPAGRRKRKRRKSTFRKSTYPKASKNKAKRAAKSLNSSTEVQTVALTSSDPAPASTSSSGLTSPTSGKSSSSKKQFLGSSGSKTPTSASKKGANLSSALAGSTSTSSPNAAKNDGTSSSSSSSKEKSLVKKGVLPKKQVKKNSTSSGSSSAVGNTPKSLLKAQKKKTILSKKLQAKSKKSKSQSQKKKKSSRGSSSSSSSSGQSQSSWIECDDCNRWVMSGCDGITDLSLYDDSNPNHIDYRCSLCRGSLDSAPSVFYTKATARFFVGDLKEVRRYVSTGPFVKDMNAMTRSVVSSTYTSSGVASSTSLHAGNTPGMDISADAGTSDSQAFFASPSGFASAPNTTASFASPTTATASTSQRKGASTAGSRAAANAEAKAALHHTPGSKASGRGNTANTASSSTNSPMASPPAGEYATRSGGANARGKSNATTASSSNNAATAPSPAAAAAAASTTGAGTNTQVWSQPAGFSAAPILAPIPAHPHSPYPAHTSITIPYGIQAPNAPVFVLNAQLAQALDPNLKFARVEQEMLRLAETIVLTQQQHLKTSFDVAMAHAEEQEKANEMAEPESSSGPNGPSGVVSNATTTNSMDIDAEGHASTAGEQAPGATAQRSSSSSSAPGQSRPLPPLSDKSKQMLALLEQRFQEEVLNMRSLLANSMAHMMDQHRLESERSILAILQEREALDTNAEARILDQFQQFAAMKTQQLLTKTLALYQQDCPALATATLPPLNGHPSHSQGTANPTTSSASTTANQMTSSSAPGPSASAPAASASTTSKKSSNATSPATAATTSTRTPEKSSTSAQKMVVDPAPAPAHAVVTSPQAHADVAPSHSHEKSAHESKENQMKIDAPPPASAPSAVAPASAASSHAGTGILLSDQATETSKMNVEGHSSVSTISKGATSSSHQESALESTTMATTAVLGSSGTTALSNGAMQGALKDVSPASGSASPNASGLISSMSVVNSSMATGTTAIPKPPPPTPNLSSASIPPPSSSSSSSVPAPPAPTPTLLAAPSPTTAPSPTSLASSAGADSSLSKSSETGVFATSDPTTLPSATTAEGNSSYMSAAVEREATHAGLTTNGPTSFHHAASLQHGEVPTSAVMELTPTTTMVTGDEHSSDLTHQTTGASSATADRMGTSLHLAEAGHSHPHQQLADDMPTEHSHTTAAHETSHVASGEETETEREKEKDEEEAVLHHQAHQLHHHHPSASSSGMDVDPESMFPSDLDEPAIV